jgi:hypothetical protein
MPRFYTLGLLSAVAIAWLAAAIHASGRAPIGLISVAVGAILGTAVIAIAVMLRSPQRPGLRRLILATIALSLITILAQHAWLYLEYRRQWHEARASSPHAALFRSQQFQSDAPVSPSEYFWREATPRRITLWCLDATIIVVSAAGTCIVLHNQLKMTSNPQPPAPSL